MAEDIRELTVMQWAKVASDWQARARAAEARVEAARESVKRLAHRHPLAYQRGVPPCLRCELDAALACPPQQRGE